LALDPSNDVVPPSIDDIERVYRQRYQRFYRLARAFTSDDQAAVDAVQEAFARAIRDRMAFRGDANFETWLWRTLLNVCVDERRQPRPFVEDESGKLHQETSRSNGDGDAQECGLGTPSPLEISLPLSRPSRPKVMLLIET
jgi:RNA polymerase sigma factor (sigma-70 family)